jgi:hypothetical protein
MARKPKQRKDEQEVQPNVQSENVQYMEMTQKVVLFDIELRGVTYKIPAGNDINFSTIFIALLNLEDPRIDKVFESTNLKLSDYTGKQIWPLL